MSQADKAFKPLSLAQHFLPPENYKGSFGWICGYSADVPFLNDAAERFTGQTEAQRSYEGRVAMALLLDPGNPGISLAVAPGILHLPIKDPRERPFALLHAKIALLSFAHEKEQGRWKLRLLVSTGNWTRQTLEESLDLVWRIDLASEDLDAPDKTNQQLCSDISSAWDCLLWLKEFFDVRALGANLAGREESSTSQAMINLADWLQDVSGHTGNVTPRFMDNRSQSLLDQLPGMVQAAGKTIRRNYLALGSGYYEGPTGKNEVPKVLVRIVESLQKAKLLTGRHEKDVFVNPNACQSVADAQGAMLRAGYCIRPAGQPDYYSKNMSRGLHAKFIFSCGKREDSNACNSAWLYLGSGNLTGPGFASKASQAGGNLEAGVVFSPQDLYWKKRYRINPAQVLTNVLPVQWGHDINETEIKLLAGESMPDRDVAFSAAPVAWVVWIEHSEVGCLELPDAVPPSFELLDEAGNSCQPDAQGAYPWPSKMPRQVQVRWKDNAAIFTSYLPVLDKFGRLAATTLPQIDLNQAWWQLANFPMPPDDEDIESVDDKPGSGETGQQVDTPEHTATYPIRQMMLLVENIAAKQTTLSQVDWVTWCARLEQSLEQAACDTNLQWFLDYGINPLSPLWKEPFRPTFAETNATPEGRRYESVLQNVEMKWGVQSLQALGGGNESVL